MGVLVMIMILALASLGVGYGLWSKILFIEGTVNTGNVHALFQEAFTDDDDKIDNPAKDSMDTDACIDYGDVDQYTIEDDNPTPGFSSCDPAASGRDPKPHHDKDVGACIAAITDDPNVATVTKWNVYPGYFCTAWFDVVNDGSIPVKVESVTIDGKPVSPSVPTPFDLNGDDEADVKIHVSDIKICQQIDPGEIVQMDIDQEVLQPAPQGTSLSYKVQVQLNQWNEAQCSVLLYYGNSGVGPGNARGYPGATGELYSLKAYYESLGFVVDYTDEWPDDLLNYRLILLYGSGNEDDANFYTVGQVADLKAAVEHGKRIVVSTDWNGFGGTEVPNKLLRDLGVGIQKVTPTTYATPDGDTCPPLTDIAPEMALYMDFVDPAATTPLDLSGLAYALAKVDPAPYTCDSGVMNGAAWMARDGQVVVHGDPNSIDDSYGFGDPNGDGMSGKGLADYFISY
jgi:hypothetical protein